MRAGVLGADSSRQTGLFFDCLLQSGNRFDALCDGIFDHTLVYAVTGVAFDSVPQIVLRLHDAQDRPSDRVVRIPLTEVGTLFLLTASCFDF